MLNMKWLVIALLTACSASNSPIRGIASVSSSFDYSICGQISAKRGKAFILDKEKRTFLLTPHEKAAPEVISSLKALTSATHGCVLSTKKPSETNEFVFFVETLDLN
jgi:hypothetical protein